MKRRAVLKGGAAVGAVLTGGYVARNVYARFARPDPVASVTFESGSGWDRDDGDPHEPPTVEWNDERRTVVARGVVAVGSTDHEARLESITFDASAGVLRIAVGPHLPGPARARRILLFFVGIPDVLRIDSYELRATLESVPDRVVVDQVDFRGEVRTAELALQGDGGH